MLNDIKEILVSESEINSIVDRISKQINEDYKDKNLH